MSNTPEYALHNSQDQYERLINMLDEEGQLQGVSNNDTPFNR